MTQAELNEILKRHQHWMKEDCDKWESMKANLYGANLHGADLRGANLRGADLYGANLYGADLRGSNLRGADLRGADLRGANLYGADLRGANLRGADLRGANLYGADLYGADLRGANLYGANLYGADLRGANLRGADLRGADLRGADLRGANLYGADLYGAINIPYVPYACPEFGMFIGYKKAGKNGKYIVELEIPEDAKRTCATTRKCRCSKAKVLSISTLNGETTGIKECCSNYDSDFIYRVGEIVEVENFDENRWNECSTGIHFFLNRQEAVEY